MLTFTSRDRIRAILVFEAALARALANAGVISEKAAEAIRSQCDVAHFDASHIEHAATAAGNIAIPIVEQLRDRVSAVDPVAATYVHWSATSQDAIDTGLVLQLRDTLVSINAELSNLLACLAELAMAHAETPMVGRTLMQHASPTTFGFKVATWIDPLLRDRERLLDLGRRAATLQLGGAVGTLSVLSDGPSVAALVAKELDLELPAITWHSSRDRVAEVATTLALLVGTLGKMARDLSLMAQSEIDEVRESSADGRGRSSTLPHKRNPVSCASILAAAVRAPHLAATMLSAMVHEHERALGAWQAEWDTLPLLCETAHSAVSEASRMIAGLAVNTDRMKANIDATRGLVFAEAVSFALASRIGRSRSKAILDRALRRVDGGAHLHEVLASDAEARDLLSPTDIEELFDVRKQFGVAPEAARAIALRAREAVKRA